MTRYLTPPKIALLCLISVYTEGVVPNGSVIHFLSFLVSCLFPLDPEGLPPFSSECENHCMISMSNLEEVLLPHESSIPGRSIWDLFLRKIWSLNSLDALEVFFSAISSVLAKTREEQLLEREYGIVPDTGVMRLSRSSPMGVFVRRAQLEFTRLQFHDSVKLWKSFVMYRLSTYHAWARKNPMNDQGAVDANLVEIGESSSHMLANAVYGNVEVDEDDERMVSTKDVERMMSFQVGELQRLGGRIPDGMKKKLERIILSGVTVPSLAHYLRFLDAWRAGDYPTSFDNLHRYFDYTMQNRDRSSYQYALLSLAVLQADFGCRGEAISAMQEAVSIARESHDVHCLHFCMSWLYHFGKAFPHQMKDVQNTGMLGNEKEGLAFLKTKAKESEMWSLLSTTLLSEARLELQNGDSLASALENVVRASSLNTTKHLLSSMGPQFLLQTATYARLGITRLSWLSSEIFRMCYANKAPSDDVLRSTFRSCQLLAQKGRYNAAFARIRGVSPERVHSLRTYQQWSFFSGILQLRRLVCRHDRTAADHLLSQLQAIQLPDLDVSLQLCFLSIEYSIRKGHYTSALNYIERTAQLVQQGNFDIHYQISLLCFKAKTFEKLGEPQRGFTLAMRAARSAYHSRMLPDLCEAVCGIAASFLGLQEFEAANEIVESVMPQILEVEDCSLSARGYSLLADANMGIAGALWRLEKGGNRRGHHANTSTRKEYVNRALGYIDCAYEQFEEIEDVKGQCEMMAKKATVMHLTGDLVLANDYAAKYLALRKRKEHTGRYY